MTSYEKVFSNNIRKYRKQHGLTQKMLAEAVGYSEKTVSKWETEGCIPPIDSLFNIANVFHVDLNSLFQGHETIYYLGIDGGGTKTALALSDYTGKIIRQLRLDSCNPFDVGLGATISVLKNGIQQICSNISFSNIVLFAGIAGVGSGNYREPIEEFLKEFHFAHSAIGTDNENIIAAGLGQDNGITMILGTGICSYSVKDGKCHHRISGWGYLFDEGGSGFNIARDAFSKYFSAYDGSGEPTSLVARIDERAGCDYRTLMSRLYEGGKKVIASYADIVFEEAEKGDAAACSILRRNMKEAARVLRAAKSHFTENEYPVPVILAGGLTEQPLLLPYLREALGDAEKGLELKILNVTPVEGAIQKAKYIWKEVLDQ